MAADELAAALAEIGERQEFAVTGVDKYLVGPADPARQLRALITLADEDVPRLLAALDKTLKLHGAEPWYLAAADCEHPEPADDMSDEWADWDDTHPPGSGDVGRVCRLTQLHSFCPECTRVAYGDDEAAGDDFVSAPCGTRSAILAALTGKENADG